MKSPYLDKVRTYCPQLCETTKATENDNQLQTGNADKDRKFGLKLSSTV
ncbi:MAG: hypothetical protein PHR16_13195 [Methylovulum sp.]|nr:hypothetical protein [Methylovulum sp.]